MSSVQYTMPSTEMSTLPGISPANNNVWRNSKPTASAHAQMPSADHHVSASVWLSWKDLTLTAKSLSSPILQGVTGYTEPGHMLAIMGPSGSGKSSLLNALAGRLPRNTVLAGEILLNGKPQSLAHGTAAYVQQEDTLIGTLTVSETIYYSAHLRLPDKMSQQEKADIVEKTIMEMGLQDCKDTAIGNWHLRGISGGEKRRVSIATELLVRPRVLFLDEPTSGLDSASAFFVIQTVRDLARQGRTVIASIHQPSSEVFALFDHLCLLSAGNTVYFGETIQCYQFFEDAGFPCPRLRNPSDHFIRCINSDFDRMKVTLQGSSPWKDANSNSNNRLEGISAEESTRILTSHYQNSSYSMFTNAKVQEASEITGSVRKVGASQASFLMQTWTLTKRSFKNMNRDLGYYWLRLAIYIAMAISLGSIFFDLGTKYEDIRDRGSFTAFIVSFLTFMTIGGFPSFVEDMKVFHTERKNGHYSVMAFVIANTLSSQLFLAIITITSGTIAYNMARLQRQWDRFLHFEMNLYLCMAVVESLMMVVSAVVPSYLMGIISGAGILGLFILSCGFFRNLSSLPKLLWRYPMSYIAFHTWSLQGQYKNDFVGLEFEPKYPGMPKIVGEEAIKAFYGPYYNMSKWWDLGIILSMVFAYRLLFLLIIKCKERLSQRQALPCAAKDQRNVNTDAVNIKSSPNNAHIAIGPEAGFSSPSTLAILA